MTSEIAIYNLVQHAKEICDDLGLRLAWYSEGWRLDTGKTIEIGETVKELHFYLNGFRDGRAFNE